MPASADSEPRYLRTCSARAKAASADGLIIVSTDGHCLLHAGEQPDADEYGDEHVLLHTDGHGVLLSHDHPQA